MTREAPIIVILWKEYNNQQNRLNIQKSWMFYENWLYQEQRPF